MSSPFSQPQQQHHENTILLITASGGGGHTAASNNIARRLQAECEGDGRQLRIVKLDAVDKELNVFWLKRATDVMYNSSSVSGDSTLQRIAVGAQPIVDVSLSPFVFRKMLKQLQLYKPTRVISTQPLGLLPMVLAVRVYNSLGGFPPLFFEIFLSDLPTSLAVHFFRPLRTIPPSLRNLVKVYTVPPLLNGRQTPISSRAQGLSEEQFWKWNTHLRMDQIIYLCLESMFYNPQHREPTPIAQPFIDLMPTVGKEVLLRIEFASEEEKHIVENVAPEVFETKDDTSASVRIAAQDTVVSIMLGSNPSTTTTIDYIERYLSSTGFRDQLHARCQTMHRRNLPYHCFFIIFCGRHKVGDTESGLSVVANYMKQLMVDHKNADMLSMIRFLPLAFQSSASVAAVTARSDLCLRQAGGLSSMEILSLAMKSSYLRVPQRFLIHVPLGERKDLNQEKVTCVELQQKAKEFYEKEHSPSQIRFTQLSLGSNWNDECYAYYLIHKCYRPWESGNAEYLNQTIGAGIVNPRFCSDSLFRLHDLGGHFGYSSPAVERPYQSTA